MGNVTPMMQQYLDIKKGYPGTILFYRMGDFYEMFYEDALVASRVLGLTLTTRDKGRENPIPMCGVPYHSASSYVSRLIRQGFKVAVCEQGDVSASGKGLVHREVMQVITPGLIVEDDHLTSDKANYLMAMAGDVKASRFGVAFIDISTGDFRVTEVGSARDLHAEVHRVSPSEVVASDASLIPEGFYSTLQDAPLAVERAKSLLTGHFKLMGIEGLGLKDHEQALVAAGMVLDYVRETRRGTLPHITSLRFYNPGRYMLLGSNTRRNLELFESISGARENTLFSVMNRTSTPMGARLLSDWISFPLMDPDEIALRQGAVEEAARTQGMGDGLKAVLGEIPDLERIVGRISAGSASPRDVRSLANGLEKIPDLRALIGSAGSALLADIFGRMQPLSEVIERIDATIVPDPPARVSDGGVIAAGLDAELDELRLLRKDSRQWIVNLEAHERAVTGINSLKVGYNKVFGYYIEISHAHAGKAPETYMRKQTLVNAERFITPELKEYEAKVLGAQDAIARIEARIFAGLVEYLVGWIPDLKTTIGAVANLDVLCSLALLALERSYRRPEVSRGRLIAIEGGRHPVVEQVLKPGEFVPNDCSFDGERDTIHIITGPNMAGKSTYMRQVALIAIMAQMGSFVPADKAVIGVVDRIFTRVGALDNLSAGQSTFLVEMTETAEILNNATEKSLVVLDEIGRGTSTYDGMSLAWAVAEYLDGKKARTLFATHYHELSDLARRHPGIKNLHMAVEESGHEVIFLREVRRGAIGRSYGIYVAKLAGIPEEVVDNARAILGTIGKKGKAVPVMHRDAPVQGNLFGDAAPEDHADVIEKIRAVDLERVTPIEALNLLHEIRKKIK